MYNEQNSNLDANKEVADLSSLFNFKDIKDNMKSIAQSNADILGFMGGMDIKAMEVAKSFGVGAENVLGIKRAVVAARDDVFALGGSWNNLFENQIAVSSALGRNVTLSVEGQRELFAASKVSGKAVGEIVTAFKDIGISAYDAGDQMGKVLQAAREQGVSAQKVSEMVLKNVSSMNQYNFKDGVEGLSKMAAQAVSMRLDMGEIMKTADRAFSPDGAIKMAAELQRLGVTQSELLDPLNLMNLAENDPAELQNQMIEMSRQFVQMNEKGQFEILPGAKRQLREIEKSLGMSTGSLAKLALGSAEAEEKMKRIRFPSFVNEEQKQMLANLSEMKDGQMMITINGEEMRLDDALRKASEEGQKGVEELLEAAKPKTVEQLAESQLNVLQSINAGINLLRGVVPAGITRTKTGEKIVRGLGSTPKDLSKAVLKSAGGTVGISKNIDENVFKPFKDLDLKKTVNEFIGLTNGSITLGQEFDKLQNRVSKMFGGDVLGTIKEGGASFKRNLGEEIAPILIQDAIISPSTGTFKTLKQDDIYVGTGLSDMLDKLVELKNVSSVKPADLITNVPTITEQEKVTTVESKVSPTEMKIDLNINVTAPPQIDTNQITNVLKDQFVIQQIIQKIEQVTSNNNLTKTPR